MDRPRADPLRAVRRARRRASPRSATSWLDAGIVPFSTLGWENPEWIEHGYATGAAAGLTGADLPDHAYWEKWFPADWVSEMREQIRLWFYSQFFMSVALVGRSPYKRVLGYEKMLDERGREMHGSWGNSIEAEDAFERMGADVMRWQYCAQPPDRNLLFGFGPAARDQAEAADVLELGLVPRRLREHRGLRAVAARSSPTATCSRSTAGSSRGRTQLVARGDRGVRGDYWTLGRRSAPSRRSSTTSRTGTSAARGGASGTTTRPRSGRSGTRSSQSLRVISPVMPFLADHLWRNLVGRGGVGPPRAWPEPGEPDDALLAEIAEVRRVVELGRQARSTSRLKLRQPLRRLVVEGAPLARGARGRDRRRAARQGGRVRRGRGVRAAREAEPAGARPEARRGARATCASSSRAASSRSSTAAASRSTATCSSPTRCSSSASAARAGRSRATTGVTVALETALDDELLARGAPARPDPRGERAAPGERASRSPTASGSGSPTRTCSSATRDRLMARDARRLGRARRAADREGMRYRGRGCSCALALAGCGGVVVRQPKDDPKQAAVEGADQIVHNHYAAGVGRPASGRSGGRAARRVRRLRDAARR